MELIKQDGANIVYRINSGFRMSESTLSGVNWAGGVKRVSLVFEKGGISEEDLCGCLPQGYDMRIVYSVNKEELSRISVPSKNGKISLEIPSDLSDLKSFFMKTIEDYYILPFSSRVPPGLRQETKEFVENKLSLEGNIYLMKGSERIGFISLVGSKNAAGVPINLIPWIWVDGKLSPADRLVAHAKIIECLKDKAKGEINAWVDSFNIRSIKFFRKLGFMPSCAHITRR